jgi:uncharacterized protein YoxC
MASLGKKILSAFVDIEEEHESDSNIAGISENKTPASFSTSEVNLEKFKAYFESLFTEANLPGPDYFEFSKMVAAMQSIPDEKTRYISAFAGLSVQGLSKDGLTGSAAKYLSILETDAVNFSETVNAALQEKVEQKKQQLKSKTERIQELTKEINDLNNSILLLGGEIKDNEEKITNNIHGYHAELEKFKVKIKDDIQKINNLL